MIRTTISLPKEYFESLNSIKWDVGAKSLSNLISNIVHSYLSDYKEKQKLSILEKNYKKYATNFDKKWFKKIECCLLWDIK